MRVKWLPITLIVTLMTDVGFAGVIHRFVDSQGILHISNVETAAPLGTPVSPLGPRPVTPAVYDPASQSKSMEPLPVLPVPLVLALIRNESNFTIQAVFPKGAMGLMQLMPDKAQLLDVQDPFSPQENILGGCRYFRYLLNYFQESVPLALASYNVGSQRVIAAGYQVPRIKEPQGFVTQVMALYYLLDQLSAL